VVRICFNTEEENILIQKTLSGDEYAFKELTEPYVPMLYNYIKIKVSGNADIEDILQDTMLAIWQSLDKYSAQSAFKTWIVSIAKHRIADFYRLNAVGRDFLGAPLSDDIADNNTFSEIDDKLDLYAALSKIPEEHRELIYLVFNAGLTYEEIQNLTGMKTGTVKSRIHYIKKTLYSMLKGGDADE
jgi:RNA polymerase sigma-70 factor (ECF subfamily)